MKAQCSATVSLAPAGSAPTALTCAARISARRAVVGVRPAGWASKGSAGWAARAAAIPAASKSAAMA